jgi:hypothetical protein
MDTPIRGTTPGGESLPTLPADTKPADAGGGGDAAPAADGEHVGDAAADAMDEMDWDGGADADAGWPPTK